MLYFLGGIMKKRFIPIEKDGFYVIKDTELNFTSHQKFFKNQALYVSIQLNDLNNEVNFYKNQVTELKKMF